MQTLHPAHNNIGSSVVVQRVDNLAGFNVTKEQQQECPPGLELACACSTSLNLTVVGKNMFAVQVRVR